VAEILSFADARDAKEPHTHGAAICCACRHEWHAVVRTAPEGERITWFECPACGTIRGQFKHYFDVASGSKVFECGACGSTLWSIYQHPVGSTVCILCAGCGRDRNAMDIFP
jgi:hypothetical protein